MDQDEIDKKIKRIAAVVDFAVGKLMVIIIILFFVCVILGLGILAMYLFTQLVHMFI